MGRYPFSNVGVSGNITSVFGRTGSVVAAAGDYAIGQITGPATVSLNEKGADPTGAAFSDTAMAAALTAIASGGLITAQPGTYKFANSYVFGPGQGIATGQALTAVIFNYTGSTKLFHSFDAAFNTSDTNPLLSICGPMSGFTIDGTSAGAAASGLQVGDQNYPYVNIGARNFTGATAIGLWAANTVGWMNEGSVTAQLDNCTNGLVLDAVGGGSVSYGDVNWNLTVKTLTNQNAVVGQNGAQAIGGSFQLGGEFIAGAAANTGYVLKLGADSSSAGIRNMAIFNVVVEAAAGAGTVGHTTIGLGSSAFLMQNAGQLVFRNQGGNFQASAGTATYRFTHSGYAESQTSDPQIGNPAVNGVALSTIGSSLWQTGATDATHIYNGTGDYFAITLANGANALAIANPVAGKAQKILLMAVQPASGAVATLTITGAKSPQGGGAVALTATNNAIDRVDIWTLDGVTWYAGILDSNYH